MPDVKVAEVSGVQRVRVFIDFWNFTLSLKEIEPEFRVNWKILPGWFSKEAGSLALGGTHSNLQYEGTHLHLSYNPKKEHDRKLRDWALKFLDRIPGVQVVCKERVPKHPTICQACHGEIITCPHCSQPVAGTIEKGIDTGIVTDMIKLAWEDAYDIGVLVSSDRDFIPAVEFLHTKGKKIVHAGFPPQGMELARTCWVSLDIKRRIEEFRRR